MQFNDNFIRALKDYSLLLNKRYPEKSIHELVSTRYSLNHFERSMLYRGITTVEMAISRRARLVTRDKLKNSTLHLDVFNALFTIAAYLRGFPVYISNDGLMRDASESHDSNEFVEHLLKALDLLMVYLDELELPKVVCYLDNPLHLSGMVAKEIEKKAGSLNTGIEIIRDESPDHLIREVKEGILTTSDSTIIDRTELPVFDLPRNLLETRFNPKLLWLETD